MSKVLAGLRAPQGPVTLMLISQGCSPGQVAKPAFSLRFGVTTGSFQPHVSCWPACFNFCLECLTCTSFGHKTYSSSTHQCQRATMMYGVEFPLLHLHYNPHSSVTEHENKPVWSTSITPNSECGLISLWCQPSSSCDTEGQKSYGQCVGERCLGLKSPSPTVWGIADHYFRCCSSSKDCINNHSDGILPVYPQLKCFFSFWSSISKGYL